MPARYVLGVGGVDRAAGAEEWAQSHAALAGVPLVRVHVATSDAGAPFRRAAEGPPIDHTLEPGPIPEALARFVRADDVLVVGTGKTGFIRSRVFGSLSLRIIAEAECTVAVIPEVDPRFRTGIVAGVKDDDLLPTIVRAAADEAHARTEKMELIHSSFTGLVPAPIESRGPALDRAAAIATLSDPGGKVRARVTGRPPAEALLDASRNASLLVMGSGHPRGAGHALGAVTHDVLVNINAPVLIVRPSLTDHAEP